MKSNIIAAIAVAGTLVLAAAGPVWARNPHCSGGILYVVQAVADKGKGNLDDYRREISSAVQQLEMCAGEDTVDYEAIGYLGWAYAEVDSMGPAGRAFAKAIAGLQSKGDKKKVELAINNRESFWATSFNLGIARINTAQGLYNPYTKKPENAEEESNKAAAKKAYEQALDYFQKALLLKPGDARTLRNLGTTNAFMGEYVTAEKYLLEAKAVAAHDTTDKSGEVESALASVRGNYAAQLLEEAKFDEAITYYTQLIAGEPGNPDLRTGLGDAWYNKAKKLEGDEKKAAYKAAGDAYSKGAELKPGSADLPFNGALSYQSAGEFALAEAQWRATLKARPEDIEALRSLSMTLSEQKKFPEAVETAGKAVGLDQKDKANHRLLGAMYTKAGDNLRSKQSLMAYLALEKGKKSPTASPASGAAGTKLEGSIGKPEEIVLWEADGQNYESWFYWSKGQAYHFSGGVQIEKSDWSSFLAKK